MKSRTPATLMQRPRWGRILSGVVAVTVLLPGCLPTREMRLKAEIKKAQEMYQVRRVFEDTFIPTLDQFERFSDAANVYVENVRRIAWEVGYPFTDLDELGLQYVKAMASYVDRGTLTREDALYRMRLMEKYISDEYGRRWQAEAEGIRRRRQEAMREAIELWTAWQLGLAAQRLREPVTCVQTGIVVRCY